MSKSPNLADDQINLVEIIAVLWAHKVFIVLVSLIAIFLSAYYSLTIQKKYTASAVFQIEKHDGSGFNVSGELGALASLAGLASGNLSGMSDSTSLLEQVSGREFILNINKKFLLDEDNHFNSYDPSSTDTFWKASIKKIIGLHKTEAEQNAVIEKTVIQNFRDNVSFEETDGGAITISVTHIDPNKASEYSNKFMNEIRLLIEKESNAAQDLRLGYLSETLADALQDMEETQNNLKDFALANSAMAQENFITGTLKLDEIRMERRKADEIAYVLSALVNLVKSGNLDDSSYEALRSVHPLVDDVEFRRILGMSETISAWAWPEIETVEAVSATLRDRSKRLDIEIQTIEESAKIYANSAEDLAKFKRDAKIAEATYTVLIEQVKSQSLAAGFKPETFKVFEYATPPLIPSSPNRTLIILLSTVLSLFFSCLFAIINSVQRSVYYTASTLITDVNAELNLKSKSIKRLSRRSISNISTTITKRRVLQVDEAEMQLANKKLIFVLNCGGKLTASGTSRLLATQSSNSGRNVVLWDKTGQSLIDVENTSGDNDSKLQFVNVNKNMSVMTNKSEPIVFTSREFGSKIESLLSNFDQIFICSSDDEGALALMALNDFSPTIILLAGLRSTRKLDIKKIKQNHAIDILFYD